MQVSSIYTMQMRELNILGKLLLNLGLLTGKMWDFLVLLLLFL